ncbi:MAG: hypothetical protein HYZ42_01190 [Bacteroidetes bacterium]|nr:hypothetical protein [Bacteroidota bacterium]
MAHTKEDRNGFCYHARREYTSTVSYHVNNSFYLYTTAGKVRISEKEFLLFDYHDTVLISKTRFNDIITKVELIDGDRVIELQTIINIFFPFLFFPILGFLSAVLGIYSKKILKDEQDIEFKFGVLSCLFFAITCAVYLLT